MKALVQKYLPVICLLATATLYATPLKIYGYFDLEAKVNDRDRAGRIWTFDQHHLNIISIYKLDDRFRLFTEMEWEHGINLEAGGEGSGKIYLAQGWLEYKHSQVLRLQMGKIVVPFGKYGLTYDATPTYLSTFLPGSVYGKHLNSVGHSVHLFAKWLTGLQIAGVMDLSGWGLEYFGYITNGRGPKPSELDNNSNKGIGGRLILTSPNYNCLFGTSYYSDRDGTAHNTLQTSIGMDGEINIGNFKAELEAVFNRGQLIDTVGIPINAYQKGYGYYIQGSYMFHDTFIPFLRYDRFNPNADGSIPVGESLTAGLNISITPSIYWKMEVTTSNIEFHTERYSSFVTSVAVAF